MEMKPVESKQIAAIGHDPATDTLAIQFKNWNGDIGSTYHYDNVPATMHAEMMAADSIGGFFGKHIKPEPVKHPYKKQVA